MTEKTSKLLSYVLRHAPQDIGLHLDEQGWALIDELIEKANRAGHVLDEALLRAVVSESDKKRFTISEDGQKIRAAQGHSVKVDLGHAPIRPPVLLFHGTATRFLDAILAEGLKALSRQQVHLSADEATAHRVGQRHGKPIVLSVMAGQMDTDGYKFYQAENGVWLTDSVPPAYLSVINEKSDLGGSK
ncbi:RNA 2'-phosphotransferase [Allorhizobium taibaishanense]|uniref:Probable RNA 2'-phosphotransferase n=1 Tax=Allorhizobium taibaishanense TaxID=887144 RepID=A0A1Q9A6F5_9HYPH|nr:RNA 2'-phosphotransferase [Allorhizobium taibaishanense]MBB4008724.1 putative RNA 2'-phosphotransferase [Allorhizobium taibaishanense]OLP50151.1 RNA 2'-phosphotransferase [Allorhizobium taibaishanense]